MSPHCGVGKVGDAPRIDHRGAAIRDRRVWHIQRAEQRRVIRLNRSRGDELQLIQVPREIRTEAVRARVQEQAEGAVDVARVGNAAHRDGGAVVVLGPQVHAHTCVVACDRRTVRATEGASEIVQARAPTRQGVQVESVLRSGKFAHGELIGAVTGAGHHIDGRTGSTGVEGA